MNTEFEQRVQMVYELRDKWIDRIEARLHDLTGLKLAVDGRFSYPLVSFNEDNVAINKGKKTVVSFPTDRIATYLGTDNDYGVWKFILGQLGVDRVFMEPEEHDDIEIKEERARKQLGRILKEIRKYDDDYGSIDVLGIFSASQHTIKIYAQVIAYYSISLGVDTEDLAFVVLTHELAHAYTIAGYDINGSRGLMKQKPYHWDTYVVEGLAQYYTEAICDHLKSEQSGFSNTFDRLKAKQTDPYKLYKALFNVDEDHEKIRSSMIKYRESHILVV